MSSLQYFNPPGYGTNLSAEYHYSQAVRLPGNIIRLSGQGGWDADTGEIVQPTTGSDVEDQVSRAFVNVEEILRIAGARNGWKDVYQVYAFVAGLEDFDGAVMQATVANLQKWCPDHKPLLTAIPVERLLLEGLRLEIQVDAYSSRGGKWDH